MAMPSGKSPDHIVWVRVFGPHFVQRKPSKVVQKGIYKKVRELVFKRLALEYGAFTKF
jgi:hypothetical protein